MTVNAQREAKEAYVNLLETHCSSFPSRKMSYRASIELSIRLIFSYNQLPLICPTALYTRERRGNIPFFDQKSLVELEEATSDNVDLLLSGKRRKGCRRCKLST